MEEKPLDNLRQISSQPKYRNRQILLREQLIKSSKTQSPTTTSPNSTVSKTLTEETLVPGLFKIIAARLMDLWREGSEQRDILRALVSSVCDLKTTVNELKEKK